MRKDNAGIYLSFYATLAFGLALLGHSTLIFLLLGFVVVVHKDEWLIKQVLQAFFLCIIYALVSEILGIFSFTYSIPIIGAVISGLFGAIRSLINLFIFIIAIISMTKTIKGNDADVPVLKKWADMAFQVVEKITPAPAAPVAPVEPVASPVAPATPVENTTDTTNTQN